MRAQLGSYMVAIDTVWSSYSFALKQLTDIVGPFPSHKSHPPPTPIFSRSSKAVTLSGSAHPSPLPFASSLSSSRKQGDHHRGI